MDKQNLKKQMDRKEITKFLGELLKRKRFSGIGKYWASEVSIDYGTTDVKRVDFMQFEPEGVVGVSGIEKGIFICYEIKSCKADFDSGFGRNFIGEKNYFVMPMATYKQVAFDIPSGVGVLVPIPESVQITNYEIHNEFENPTEERDFYLELLQDEDYDQIEDELTEYLTAE